MFQSMRRVFESVEKTWHTLASHGEVGDHPWEDEPNLYKRDIMMCASHLAEGVDIDVKMEAVRKMGHLAYTGRHCHFILLLVYSTFYQNLRNQSIMKNRFVDPLTCLQFTGWPDLLKNSIQ